jgi:uncharacterized 2Fe-2S/4Fe-4S cluster protein (DUF4445 family)
MQPKESSEEMPQLTVMADDTIQDLPFSQGSSVREILDAAGLRVRSGCRGNAACGLCLVQIEAGIANNPTRNELLILTPEQHEQNIRLSCQLLPENDLRIRIINPASKSDWRDLAPLHLPCAPSPLHRAAPDQAGRRVPAEAGVDSQFTEYGLAVDLGTTHISLSLWDLQHGNRISGRRGRNPQSCFGTDVVTRLLAADASPDDAGKIARMPLAAIAEAVQDICSRDGLNPWDIVQITIVGNTPMLLLLTEADSQLLLQPRFWTRAIDCRLDSNQAWAGMMGIHPEAAVEVVPPLAGFVGSDLLAGVLATHLTDHPGGLLIDFGTNSELALWDGATLWVTSAAGGPAFEGCGIRCGMPAEPGAIYNIDQQQQATGWRFQVIGAGAARGLCGSGLVDLIALLRGTGTLTSTGKLTIPHPEKGFTVQENPAIRLTNGDVDMFQRAKAAIGVGIKTLLALAKLSAAELNRVCVCGVFGQHLNISNAQSIGLLPDIPPESVEFCGNTALAGCEHLLLSPAGAADLATLRERAAIINLSRVSDFESLFLDGLFLQP